MQAMRTGARPRQPWLGLAAFVGITFAASAAGGALTVPGLGEWYAALQKPSWNPPNAVFGPVWSALYLLMAVAAWQVWREPGDTAPALRLWGVQLALNVGWSALFFALRQPGAAFFELLCLWTAILATLISFTRFSRAAAWMLVPYLAWVTFAGALNFAVWRLNP